MNDAKTYPDDKKTDAEAKSRKVYDVFERIAPVYDSGNVRISMGRQASWKRSLTGKVAADLRDVRSPKLLDLCCGTGDVAIAMANARSDARVTGLDFSEAMLAIAKQKEPHLQNLTWICADAQALPFEDETFHAATISFGLRNTTDYHGVLSEIYRTTKAGGYLYLLDACVVDNALIRPFYRFYFRRVMPLIGGGVRYKAEYDWLNESTEAFYRYDGLKDALRQAGWRRIRGTHRMFGACVLLRGQKPLE